jgi:hypothetical protein
VQVAMPDVYQYISPSYQLNKTAAFIPNEMIVTGPINLVDSIKYISLKPLMNKNIDKDINIETTVETSNMLLVDNEEVSLRLSIDKSIQKTFDCVINSEENISFYPQNCEVKINLPMNKYKNISTNDIKVVVGKSSHPYIKPLVLQGNFIEKRGLIIKPAYVVIKS